MTFGEMKDQIANRMGDSSANTLLRIGEYINDIMMRLSDEIQYPGEVRQGRIRAESGRYAYPLEPDVSQVIEPMIVPQDNANIWSAPIETFTSRVQDPTSTGTPHNFIHLGNFGVERQPASPVLFSAQTNEITATITGTIDYLDSEVALTLNSGSTTETTENFTTIDDIVLSGVPSTTLVASTNADKVKNAEFTTSETRASTSAYGVFNPGSFITLNPQGVVDLGTTITFHVKGYGVIPDDGAWADTPQAVSKDNVYMEEELTFNGTASVPTTQRITTIESLSTSAETDGFCPFEADPSSRQILLLPPKKRSVSFPVVGLYPIPDGTRITYSYYHSLTPMTTDSDVPSIDPRVHRYITKWAEAACLSWYGDSAGIQDTIQNALPSWQKDIATIRSMLGLVANNSVVIGGRAANINQNYCLTAMLDPAHYSN
jgi:hypothetical protein